MESRTYYLGKKLLVCLVLFGLSLVISQYKIVQLPSGGSVTFCSTLFLYLITYLFGVPAGLIFGGLLGGCKGMIAWGLLHTGTFTWSSMLVDDVLAFAVIAFGGMFQGRKGKRIGTLQIGYSIGMCCRFVTEFVSGLICYYDPGKTVPENVQYLLAYHGWYLLVEGIMVFLILCVPQVVDAVEYLKEVFCTKRKDITLEEF